MTQELKSCPFCGGEARLYSPTYPMSADCDDAFVACGSCDAQGPSLLCDMVDEDAEHHWPGACAEAITAWNTRAATIPDPQAFMEAARGMRGVAERLVQLCIDGGLTHDLVSQLYPDSKKSNGQPAFEFAKRAQREINEARAALRAFDATLGEQ